MVRNPYIKYRLKLHRLYKLRRQLGGRASMSSRFRTKRCRWWRLFSAEILPVTEFPLPGRAHAPPNDNLLTFVSEEVCLLAYNGWPNNAYEYAGYPFSSHEDLDNAIDELYPDCLSYAVGKTNRYELDYISHRISSYLGTPGSGLFNKKGELIRLTLS